jgi:hypothetical protein
VGEAAERGVVQLLAPLKGNKSSIRSRPNFKTSEAEGVSAHAGMLP